ncbi:uncharacterized protein LOC125381018 [Haliotis rufescens]|uniref:uncharacterized protein LOC125381018 n=1 Tax=Haliotis rufescens TaxID=6454 RepID=UPI00201EDD47|nr:uncharacterized protein LOC125381018 [Haliotis rufescens]
MASLCVLVLLVAASSVVQGHENIAAVVSQMGLLEKEINQLKVELNHLKSDVPNKMDILELLLRSDLTERIVSSYIRSQIESFEATVNSHVMSQIKHLKRGYQQMKRQTLRLTRQLGDTVKDKDACEQQREQEGDEAIFIN